MDVLQSLSNELDFDFQLYLVPDGKFGAFDPEVANWTGMVKELLDRKYHFLLCRSRYIVFHIHGELSCC